MSSRNGGLGDPVTKPPQVLLVEDDTLVRLVIADMISDIGFEIIEVSTADEAIQMLESHPDIRLVITDVVMPGTIGGLELAATIGRRWPLVEIIVTSGSICASEIALPPRSTFAAKPFDKMAFIKAVRRIDRRSGAPQ
jgi:CheY-like chemotaxis protein